MLGLSIVYPLTPALMTAIAGLCYLLTKELKKDVPQGPNQNLIIRGVCVVLGVAMAAVSLPLIPGFAYSYAALAGAAIQGGTAGAGVTAAVWATYIATSGPTTPEAPAAPPTA